MLRSAQTCFTIAVGVISKGRAMRYQQNKAQSAEFLRLALPLMASQEAALHPVSYALWYEHVAGINPELSEVLAARLNEQLPLREKDVHEFYSRYILPTDREVLERLCEKLRTYLEEVAQASATVATETGRFGRTLERSNLRLAEPLTLESVRAVVAELTAETRVMQGNAQAASEQLELQTAEVRRLTSELEQARAEALLDPLTGLKNRRGVERAVAELDGIEGAALLIADIDHFKAINDTHGHLLGDRALAAIGRILHENIKRRDLVGRWGGEEFAILLLRTPLKGAEAVAEQIRAAVESLQIRKPDGTKLEGCITVSLGIAVAEDRDGFEDLIRRADEALYRAKRDGRNRVRALEHSRELDSNNRQ
ncbi:MAG TPA: diguanylate cyclase [Steroidobacteraceae bacterium]|jgi:diguanylate cyclase